MNKLILIFIAIINLTAPLFAQEFKIDDTHQGIFYLQNGYIIFPQSRINNNLYDKEGKFLKSQKGQTIIDAFDYEEYLLIITKNIKDKKEIFYSNPDIRIARFIGSNYIQFISKNKSSFFNYKPELQSLEKIEIPYRTARGFVYNQKDILAFYRIIRYTPPNEEEEKKAFFTIKVSVLTNSDKNIVDLPGTFESASSRASLIWVDEKQLFISLKEKRQFVANF